MVDGGLQRGLLPTIQSRQSRGGRMRFSMVFSFQCVGGVFRKYTSYNTSDICIPCVSLYIQMGVILDV